MNFNSLSFDKGSLNNSEDSSKDNINLGDMLNNMTGMLDFPSIPDLDRQSQIVDGLVTPGINIPAPVYEPDFDELLGDELLGDDLLNDEDLGEDLEDEYIDYNEGNDTSDISDLDDVYKVNRTKLLYESGLYEQPFDDNGGLRSHAVVMDMLSFQNAKQHMYDNFIRFIKPIVPYDMDITMEALEKIISGINFNDTQVNNILKKFVYRENRYLSTGAYISDIIKRQAAYLRAIQTAGQESDYIKYIKTCPQAYDKRLQQLELPISVNSGTNKLTEAGTFLGLIMLAENTQPKAGLQHEDDGLLRSLVTASLYMTFLSNKLGYDPTRNFAEHYKILSSIPINDVPIERVRDALKYLLRAYTVWYIPTSKVCDRFDNFYKTVKISYDTHGAVLNKFISLKQIRTAVKFITNWSYEAFSEASRIKDLNPYINDEEKKKIIETANRSFTELLEYVLLNNFDIFANYIRRIYKDIVIKTYEPATEFQLGGNGYFDDLRTTDVNILINRIGGIMNGH